MSSRHVSPLTERLTQPLRAHASPRPERIGRYVIFGALASGGGATVHLGRQLGPVGFSRIVAIKRPHAQVQRDPELLAKFVDEVRLTSRVSHANAVTPLDVVLSGGEIFLVLEYVHGESLSRILRGLASRGERVPPAIAVAIVAGALRGLHAIHEAKDERGEPLNIVHYDVSPHNVVVGIDGLARILDLGIAKTSGSVHPVRDGAFEGKLAYMSPERVSGRPATARADIYGAAVVLWEALTGARLFATEDREELVARIVAGDFLLPGQVVADLPPGLDAIVRRGLARDPSDRFATAHEMALALESVGSSSQEQVGAWVAHVAGDALRERSAMVAEAEGAQAKGSGLWSAARAIDHEPSNAVTRTALSGSPDAASDGSSNDAPTRRIVLAQPASGLAPPLSRVRSTLLCSGFAVLRERGHFENYVRLRGAAPSLVPGTWLSVSTALAHFKACDALGLSAEEAFAIGADSGHRTQAAVLQTMTSLIAGAEVTPWSAMALYSHLWLRIFDGGSVTIAYLNERSAEISLRGIPFAGIPYFRDAFRGANYAGLRQLAPSVKVSEVASERTSTGFVLHATW
jgi:serine/threonine-protein kinase